MARVALNSRFSTETIFVYYHRLPKMIVAESANQVYNQLILYWIKFRLPTCKKPQVIEKMKDLYMEHVKLMNHRSRNNEKDQLNQQCYVALLHFSVKHYFLTDLVG